MVDDVLPMAESAALVERVQEPPPKLPASATVGVPARPHVGSNHPKPAKAPTPAAEAFVAWVAHGVATGELRYNEEGALVHFVKAGCLLLSPEIFRRFIDVHKELSTGAVAELIATHEERAFARLQNELAKSGWTRRAGDENLHHWSAVKADGSLSRPAAFYLLPNPELFWNPVPPPNERLKPTPRPPKPKQLKLSRKQEASE